MINYKILTVVIVASGLVFTGCYYDNKTDLYGTTACDTSAVTYTKDIATLVNQQCAGCHNASSPSAGIALYDYNTTKSCCQTGKFVGSVKQDGTASNMPKGGSKWGSCELSKLDAWVRKGCPQ